MARASERSRERGTACARARNEFTKMFAQNKLSHFAFFPSYSFWGRYRKRLKVKRRKKNQKMNIISRARARVFNHIL